MIEERDYDELLKFVNATLNKLADQTDGAAHSADIQICSISDDLEFNPQNERQEHYFVHDIDEENAEDLHDRILQYIEIFPGRDFSGWIIVRFADIHEGYVLKIEDRPFNGQNMPNIKFGFADIDLPHDEMQEDWEDSEDVECPYCRNVSLSELMHDNVQYANEVRRLRKVIRKLTKSIEILTK